MKKTIFAALLAATVLPVLAADYYVVVPLKKTEESITKNISVVLNAVSLPSGLAGQAYAGFDFMPALRITGDPKLDLGGVTWRVVSGALPAGLSLGADGKLTGTPAAAGTANFQLMASYKTKSGSQAYQLVVGEIVIGLAAATLPEGLQGAAYYFDLGPSVSVSGDAAYAPGAVHWVAVAGLPAGLQLTNAGVLSGTPASSGTSAIEVQAAYRGRVATRTYPLSVRSPVPELRLVAGQSTTHDFGTLSLGTDAPAQRIAVTNAGTGAGSLAMSAFSGAHSADFSATTTCTNVAPAANCEVIVGFKPNAGGVRTASLTVAGTSLSFTGTGQAAPRQYVVLETGTSYQIPTGVGTVTAWVIGAGGGGAGGPAGGWGRAGGGGGAGGVAYSAFSVSPGGTLSYTIGSGGNGGVGALGGNPGGQTALQYQAKSLTAQGGVGGYYNNLQAAPGGTATGGEAFVGGFGMGAAYPEGGGAGGGLAGAVGSRPGTTYKYDGGTAARANYPRGLDAALLAAAKQQGNPGIGAKNRAQHDGNHGGSATGYGHGGGGAAIYGGTGGNGALGGGGGGATGREGTTYAYVGGKGGNGFIVLQLN